MNMQSNSRESDVEHPILSLREAITQLDPNVTYHPWVWIEGEITDLSHRRSGAGHLYFTLSDGDTWIPCVRWGKVARDNPVPLHRGLVVRIRGWVQPHPKRGYPEFDAREILPCDRRGPRQSAIETVISRLHADGLLDPGRRRPLPPAPECIGLVTSAEGAALQDIRHILHRLAPHVCTLLEPVRVSGENAALEIAQAIQTLSRSGNVTPIIVARGGGSAADLDAFNTEVVARAIAASPVPVISAIGHEPDFTIADLVADMRCATPSEAAEIAVRGLHSPSPVQQPEGAVGELRFRFGQMAVEIRIVDRPHP